MTAGKNTAGCSGVAAFFPAVVAVFFLSACATHPPPSTGETAAIHWQEKTSREILFDLAKAQRKIGNFSAGFSISMTPPPKGRPSHLQGVLFFKKTDAGPQIRIQGLGPFGRTVFDLVQQGDRVEIYIPAKKTLYRGRRRQGTDDPWGRLFSTMFMDFSRADASARSIAVESDAVRLELANETLILDRKTGLLRERRQPEQTVRYDDYVFFTDHPPMPGRIHLEKRDGSLRADCELSQFSINADLSGAFDLSPYAPETIREISELNKR